MHRTTARFWKCFKNLPGPVQEISEKNFKLLKTNPSHPSLHFKKAGKFWSVRIGLNCRAIAIEDGEDFIWVWIGTHDEYEGTMVPGTELINIYRYLTLTSC